MKLRPRSVGLLAMAAILVVLPLLAPNAYLYDLLIRVGMNAVIVIGLNLLFGYTGQISLGHAAFVGLGAYSSAILTTHFGWNSTAALGGGALAAALLALVVARPILRLTGHHLAVATLALGLIATIVLNNETAWTGGSDGMTVPPLELFGWPVSGELSWYCVVAVLLVVACWAASNLVDSPAGRALQAIRGSEIAARVAGIDTVSFKTRVFVLSAVIASVMGSLMAHYTAFITPSAAGLGRSVEFVMMVVVGGSASVFGSVVGAALITLLPQVLSGLEGWETLVFGLILTAALIFMRDGLVPSLRAFFARRRSVTRSEAP